MLVWTTLLAVWSLPLDILANVAESRRESAQLESFRQSRSFIQNLDDNRRGKIVGADDSSTSIPISNTKATTIPPTKPTRPATELTRPTTKPTLPVTKPTTLTTEKKNSTD